MSATAGTIPAPGAAVLNGIKFTTVWYQYFWNQWNGLFPVKCSPLEAPNAPQAGFVIYCDKADGKLKAKASTGTVTILANP